MAPIQAGTVIEYQEVDGERLSRMRLPRSAKSQDPGRSRLRHFPSSGDSFIALLLDAHGNYLPYLPGRFDS